MRVHGRAGLFVAIAAVMVLPATTPVRAIDGGSDGVSTQDLEHAETIRAKFGFPSSTPFVLATFNDPQGFPDEQWGLPLSNSEAAEVSRRVDVQLAVGDAATWADERLPGYGGLWIDQSRRALAVFQVASDSAEARSALDTKVPDGIAYEVVTVERSWAELVAIKDRVLADWDELTRAGVPLVSTAIDTPTNTVLVGLDGASSEAQAELVARFGGGLTFREDRVAYADMCPWSQCLPAKGGIRMVSQQVGNACTTGFLGKVTSVSPNYRVVVTAGHCFRAGGDTGEGDDWRHYVGTTMTKFGDAQKQTWYDNSGADVGLVKLTSTPTDGNAFVGWENDVQYTIRNLTSRASNAAQAVNDYICRMGGNTASGYTCGFITAVAVDRESEITGVGSMTILNQNEVGFDSLPGDSGGAVYTNETAYGTHTHSNDPGDPGPSLSWFTPIGRGESAYSARWGVTFRLCLNDTCSVTD